MHICKICDGRQDKFIQLSKHGSLKVTTREAIVSQEKSVIFVILSLSHFSGDPKLFTMCQSKKIIHQTHKFGVFYKKRKITVSYVLSGVR